MKILVHAQVCTHTDIDNDIGVFWRCLSDFGKNVEGAILGKCEANTYNVFN